MIAMIPPRQLNTVTRGIATDSMPEQSRRLASPNLEPAQNGVRQVEFALALAIGSVSLFADKIATMECSALLSQGYAAGKSAFSLPASGTAN
jgi:hypothetical protein